MKKGDKIQVIFPGLMVDGSDWLCNAKVDRVESDLVYVNIIIPREFRFDMSGKSADPDFDCWIEKRQVGRPKNSSKVGYGGHVD